MDLPLTFVLQGKEEHHYAVDIKGVLKYNIGCSYGSSPVSSYYAISGYTPLAVRVCRAVVIVIGLAVFLIAVLL